MVIRCYEQWKKNEPLHLEKDWISGDDIPDNIRAAVICAEDQNFLNHRGFDTEAIKKALKHNQRSKRKRGASTISQQTAKNVFLWPSRSWLRKGLEVYFTALIELFWSKERIINVYLNIVELGNGIYGVEAASLNYFRKPAKKLTSAESALLGAILPNPRKYSAIKPGPYLRNRQQWILRQMKQNEISFNH